MVSGSLYGVDFHAPFPLRRDLSLRPRVGGPSAHVAAGEVGQSGTEVWRSTAPPDVRCWFDGETASLHWPDAAFAVTIDSVTVDARDPGWAFERYLNPVWSLLVGARGGTTFHAFGVETRRGNVAIMGPSGYGKSALGAEFLERGGRLIADDMLVFDAEGELQPGPTFVRIGTTHESLQDPGGKARRAVPAVGGSAVLDLVIVLTDEASEFARIERSTAVLDALLSQRYSPISVHSGVARQNLAQTVQIAATADVHSCPPRYRPVEELADRTEALLERRLATASLVDHPTGSR
jgi:hypothetical protein